MDTTWQRVSKWYDKTVGDEGHYYHQKIILPKLLELMQLKANDKVLDIACGQGVFARSISKDVNYTGFDGSANFIKIAKQNASKSQRFYVQDATMKFSFLEKDFNKAVIILALQNMERPEVCIELASERMAKGGEIFLVLNHPFFRIPKASSWGWDQSRKLQYRVVEKYLSIFGANITANPGQKSSEDTYSWHTSLSGVVKMLAKCDLKITGLEEWVSDKKSTGGRARSENISRREIPLFMCIVAEKASLFSMDYR